jgi:hypothetical protein
MRNYGFGKLCARKSILLSLVYVYTRDWLQSSEECVNESMAKDLMNLESAVATTEQVQESRRIWMTIL